MRDGVAALAVAISGFYAAAAEPNEKDEQKYDKIMAEFKVQGRVRRAPLHLDLWRQHRARQHHVCLSFVAVAEHRRLRLHGLLPCGWRLRRHQG